MLSVTIPCYNRLPELKQTIENVYHTLHNNFELIIIDDNSNKDVKDYLASVAFQLLIQDCKIQYHYINKGLSVSVNEGLKLATQPYIAHLDSDILIPFDNWGTIMENYLTWFPEIGMIAPDYPGHHLRLHRGIYDEVEYCMGGSFCIRKEIVDKIGGYDENLLPGQLEVDLCYRVRMLGYRVALIPGLTWVHLDNSQGMEKHYKGGFEFFRKWNMYHLGFFHFKSPAMMYWDDFPLNQLFRRQVCAQEGFKQGLDPLTLQGHSCEIIKTPMSIGRWREDEFCELVRANQIFWKSDTLDTVDADFLMSKKQWSAELNKDEDKKRI
jgi:glycosyltransferase involved in cell wall biosynthesis